MQETKGLISAMTGESRCGTRAAAPGCGFSRGTTARSVSLSWGAREVGSPCEWRGGARSEEHTSELRHQLISYAVFCLKKKNKKRRVEWRGRVLWGRERGGCGRGRW